MQRNEDGGIVISCDFCGTDWDEVLPMIEGHRAQFPAPGVICLECLKLALAGMGTLPGEAYACTMCRQQKLPASLPGWASPRVAPPPQPTALVCRDCAFQAAGTFSKDPDTGWKWDRKKA